MSTRFSVRFKTEVTLGLGVLLVFVLVGYVVLFGAEAQVVALLDWVDGHRLWGPAIFAAVYALFVVLVLPTLPLTFGAGFLFGIGPGTLLAVIGDTVGATVAFLTARHLLGARLARIVAHHPRLSLINERFGREGWKVVLLTRMVPFFPFKLSNYFFGMAGYTLAGFVFGTVFGIIPITLANVYIGSLAANLALLGAPGVERSRVEWALYGAGFVIALGTAIYLTRLAQKAVRDWETGPKRPPN